MSIEQFWHRILRRPYLLFSTTHGSANNPVIILLHGIAASSEDWGYLIPHLSEHYYCITIDLLGFGRSPKPIWASYDMNQHIHSLRYTIRSFGIHEPYILVGHSLGSLLATRYTRRYPRSIKRLLLLSPPVYPPLETINNRATLYRTDLLLRLYKFIRSDSRLTPETLRRLRYIIPLPRSIVKYPDTWVPFKRTLEHCIEQQSMKDDIKDLQIPTDIFYGTLDTLVIGRNVKSLGKEQAVKVFTFRGHHALSRSYGKVITKHLCMLSTDSLV